ncbi:hypothetical protein H0H93_007297 [Arthromyces matolae]|nr:hypothetical protein H0H93_007297 [Arthromyces matolae]
MATEAEILEEFRIGRDNVDTYQRASVFNSQFLRQWFLQHGYTLYSAWKNNENSYYDGLTPQMSTIYDDNPCFPYAFSGGDDLDRVMFAQDEQKRHVAIKIVKAGSPEYDILCFIREQGIHDSIEEFNHVIPVLDMLPFGEFWFVVMPRWGDDFCRPVGPRLKEVFDVLRGSLKDISSANILVNHFGRYYIEHRNPHRQQMRQQGRLTCGILDFELSVKFPASYSDEQCRLPYRMSWHGTPGYTPLDTCQGEFDYDPFAWDVACMGLVFCDYYDVGSTFTHHFLLLMDVLDQHLIVHAPMLAPFFDKMVTRDVSKRFTAQQALSFLEEEVYPRTSVSQLNLEVEKEDYILRDRWEGLDPAFLKEWAEYREPPLPLTTKFLYSICEYVWVLHTIASIRKSAYQIRQIMSKLSSYLFKRHPEH